jgi:hypothetical protein
MVGSYATGQGTVGRLSDWVHRTSPRSAASRSATVSAWYGCTGRASVGRLCSLRHRWKLTAASPYFAAVGRLSSLPSPYLIPQRERIRHYRHRWGRCGSWIMGPNDQARLLDWTRLPNTLIPATSANSSAQTRIGQKTSRKSRMQEDRVWKSGIRTSGFDSDLVYEIKVSFRLLPILLVQLLVKVLTRNTDMVLHMKTRSQRE